MHSDKIIADMIRKMYQATFHTISIPVSYGSKTNYRQTLRDLKSCTSVFGKMKNYSQQISVNNKMRDSGALFDQEIKKIRNSIHMNSDNLSADDEKILSFFYLICILMVRIEDDREMSISQKESRAIATLVSYMSHY